MLHMNHDNFYAWLRDYGYFSFLRDISGSKDSHQRGTATLIIITYLTSQNVNRQK